MYFNINYTLNVPLNFVKWGVPEKGIQPHPYTELLLSLPFVSKNTACTLIGVIGDIERFNTYKDFKKYLGVSAENTQSGTSVKGPQWGSGCSSCSLSDNNS